MENQKMMSKWKKFGIVTVIAAFLVILPVLFKPSVNQASLWWDISVFILNIPFIFIMWVAFSVSLFYSGNKPFLPSGKEDIKRQTLHAFKFGLIFLTTLVGLQVIFSAMMR